MKKFFIWASSAFALITLFAPLQGAWNPDVSVSGVGDSSPVGGPNMDLNYLNNGVATWATPTIFGVIQASSYTFGFGWGVPVTISDTSLNQFGDPNYIGQSDPSISINNSNYVVVTWEGSVFIDEIMNNVEGIFSATRTSDGVWSPVQTVSLLNTVDSDFNPENPFVDVSESGLAVAVWTELRDDDRYIMANFLPFGGVWGTPVELANPFQGFREDTPMVQINSDNNAAAVWKVQDAGGGDEIGVSTYNASTNLWTTLVLDEPEEVIGLPRVGIDESGNAVAVWTRRNGNLFEVVSSSFNFATGTWGPIVVITSEDLLEGNIRTSYVVVDQVGNATAIWTAAINGINQVYGSTLPFGGVWSTPEVISTLGINNSLDDTLAQMPIGVDPSGNVIVIFATEDNTLQSVSYFQGFGWQVPETIATTDSNIWTSIRYGSCGFALALWHENNTVQAADNFGIFPPPSGFSGSRCCQKFASQTKCLSLLNWDENFCIAFFEIRRNGVLIATLPAGSTSFVDPVCSRRESVTFTITAINIFGASSAPVAITVP